MLADSIRVEEAIILTAAGALATGDGVAGYRVLSPLGRGGMGVVYLAEQPSLGRQVALKIVAPELTGDPAFRARFEHESRVAASLDHPNVVPVYEAGEETGLLYIAMRYVPGIDLGELLRRERPLPPVRAARLVNQVALALDAAHRLGLVHRDVKPANVLVAEDDHVYLTDFGLTKHVTSHDGLTATGQWVGTLDYVAPEQIEGGNVDARADVYSLGCLLFAAACGQVPFARDSDMAKLFAHVHQPPPRPSAVAPGLPAALDEVILRALAKNPAQRQQSSGDLGREAVAAAEGSAPPSLSGSVAAGAAAPRRSDSAGRTRLDTVAAMPAAAAPRRRRGIPIALVAAALIIAGGGVAAAVVATGRKSGSAGVRAARSNTALTSQANSRHGKRPGIRYERFIAPTYAADIPLGWRQVQDYQPQSGGSYYRTKFTHGASTVLIDTTPNSSGDPRQTAVAQEPSGTPGYRRLRWRYTKLGSDRAFDWVFQLNGQRREDLLFYRGRDGFGVLGEGRPANSRQILTITRHIAGSVSPR